MQTSDMKKKALKFTGYLLTVAVGFALYVFLREYIFTKFNDTGSLDSEIEKVSRQMPISDAEGILTIDSLKYDEQYNLTFMITIDPKWSHFPPNANKDEILKILHATDNKKDTSVLCGQTLIRLAIGAGGMVWVKYTVPGRDIENETVRIECSPLEQ